MLDSPALTTTQTILGLAVALGSGLLIGIERERRRDGENFPAVAGIRTFTLVALAGAVCALLGMLLIAVGGGFVALLAVHSYRITRQQDPGLTTEVALFVTFLLGALAMTSPKLTAGLAAAVALLLAMRVHLHRLSREVLSPQEWHDALLLIAAALIVLPLLPNQTIDPWHSLNPHKLWRLVVILMTIQAAGYVAQRVWGERLGLALAGLAGGFVSSTASIGAMGARCRESPEHTRACALAGVLSNVATLVQIALIVLAIEPRLMASMALPLTISMLALILVSVLYGREVWRDRNTTALQLKGRPFEPRFALFFAALLSGMILISAVLTHWLGTHGALLSAALAGLADAHAAVATMVQLHAANRLDTTPAGWGILLGLASNTLSKSVVAWSMGGKAYFWRVLPALVAMLLGFALTWLWLQLRPM